jgi:hypothetical protein
MTYWGINKHFIKPLITIYNQLSKEEKIIFIDGGAAGTISQPFDVVAECITPYRFEPRGENAITIGGADKYIDGGLWSVDTVKSLHVAYNPKTSSICPPNFNFLDQFDDTYGSEVRRTQKTTMVKLRSIDSCVNFAEIPYPNFIKLDLHSSELPALIGAKNSLKDCVGLLIETWHSEVHKDQGLHHEVEKFCMENGFEVYDSICASRWRYKHKGEINLTDKGRYIGTEILFIKKDVSEKLILKKAFILCLFGFGNEAKNVLSFARDEKVRDYFQAAITSVQKAKSRSYRILCKKFLNRIFQFIK